MDGATVSQSSPAIDSNGHKASPPVSSAPKPWKVKRSSQKLSSLPAFEIFEGKPLVVDFGLKVAEPKEYIRVGSQGGFEFVVPLEVVRSFTAIETAFGQDGVFKERRENRITFPDINPEVLEKVIQFSFTEYIQKLKDVSLLGAGAPRTIFQFEVDPGLAMDLVSATHYLGQESLLSMCTTMVARHIADVADVSTLPVHIAQCIAEQLTPHDLLVAEGRDDFKSLGLDTEHIWQAHCQQLGGAILLTPKSKQEDTRRALPPLPPSWKSAYVTYYLQRLANKQTGESTEELFKELQKWGRYATSHTIYLPLWEDVILPLGPSGLVTYLSAMGNLTSLVLQAGLPLGVGLEGEEHCHCLGQVLEVLPHLQVLQATNVGLTAAGASSLGAALSKHTSLQVLHLGDNNIQSEGLQEIFRGLPGTGSLKVLDVSDANLSSAIAEDAVSCLERSSLEELVLDGGVDLSLSRPAWTSRMERRGAPGGSLLSGLVVPFISCYPPGLKKLSMRSRGLTDGQIRVLARALATLTALEILILSDNHITGRTAAVIFTWLQGNCSLKTLKLEQNKIDDDCMPALIDALRQNSSLTNLSLSSNFTFGDELLGEFLQAAIAHGDVVHSREPSQHLEINLRGTASARRSVHTQTLGTHVRITV